MRAFVERGNYDAAEKGENGRNGMPRRSDGKKRKRVRLRVVRSLTADCGY